VLLVGGQVVGGQRRQAGHATVVGPSQEGLEVAEVAADGGDAQRLFTGRQV
jgi:hypothetical protein